MGVDFAHAYDQIKNLENTSQLTLPETVEAVEVGTIDPAAGTFEWTVPTVTQTVLPLSDPPLPGSGPQLGDVDPTTPFIARIGGGGSIGMPPLGTALPPLPPATPISITVGVVATKAVDLRLKFAVVPIRPQVEVMEAVTGGPAPLLTVPNAARAELIRAGAGPLIQGSNGGVTISGFPTVSSMADEITIDAGLVCSQAYEAVNVSPAMSRFDLSIDIPGHDEISVSLFIIRPPVVGIGAFTIPELPMAIVYAPPQTKQLKNVAQYTETETLTRTVTTSVSRSTATKTASAYSVADLIGKVGVAIATVAAVVGTGGAAAAAGPSVAGALAELGDALFGKAKDANDATVEANKQVSAELKLVSDALSGLDTTPTTSDSSSITTTDEHTLTLTLSSMSQYQSAAGLGPGLGDRIVCLEDVKVVWMALNGEVDIVVLGYAGTAVFAVRDLVTERARLASGGVPELRLTAETVDYLLSQDPLAPPKHLLSAGLFGPAVIVPPRFTPASPGERRGTSTGGSGDVYQVTFDPGSEDKDVTTNSSVRISDAKPGWLSVIFGSDDTETTTTETLTTTNTTDTKTDDKLVSSVTFYSVDGTDEYDAKNFYDNVYGTYLFLPPGSPFITGQTPVFEEPVVSMP
jgi:hypothetical protein